MSKQQYNKIRNPSGTYSFGTIPYMVSQKEVFYEGEIILHLGNRHYGATHIWTRHNHEMKAVNKSYINIGFVPSFICDIVKEGTKILCEFDDIGGNHNLILLEHPIGVVIVKPTSFKEEFYYSVITAYTKKSPHGVLIGKVQL